MIGDVKVTLANLYAPNDHQDVLLGKALPRLTNFAGHLIVGGDLNIPLVPAEHTSSSLSSVSPSSRKRIAQSLHKSQLIDIWHLLRPTERDFTFYSLPHKAYSRIDYFFIPYAQLHTVFPLTIGSITWSDHPPIFLSYALHDSMTAKTKYWRLN